MKEFIEGFAEAAGLTKIEAEAQWAGWSNQLDDDERLEIEDGGRQNGIVEGLKFKAVYGDSQ